MTLNHLLSCLQEVNGKSVFAGRAMKRAERRNILAQQNEHNRRQRQEGSRVRILSFTPSSSSLIIADQSD